jgi:DNA invertase Pin-like site-specific DNA recombinase
MHPEQQIAVQKRRPRSQVRQLVSEFVNSGIEATEFCRSRGLSRSTLYHHLKKRPSEGNPASDGIELLAVEVAGVKCSSPMGEPKLAVVLGNARRVEVNPGFDAATLARLVSVLEGV